MDLEEFEKILKDRNIKKTWLIKQLNIAPSTFYSKINNKTDFTYTEILNIKNILKLTSEEFQRIFTFK